MGIQSYRSQGCEGEVSGVRVTTARRRYLYVMAVLSGSRVVRGMCVCVAAPFCWAACGCARDAAKFAWRWLTPPSRAFVKRFLFLMIHIRQDVAKFVNESNDDMNRAKSWVIAL